VVHYSFVELPIGVRVWVEATFGSAPVVELFAARQISDVFGLRLADGQEIVVKVRSGLQRARACVEGSAPCTPMGLPALAR
jgi:hypothetical protein